MKKVKFLPFLLMPLLLASCQSNSFVGEYTFQMGKNSGTHFSVGMNLNKNEVTNDGEVVGKEIKISLSAKLADATKDDEDNPLYFLYDILAEGINIDGYYNIGNKMAQDNYKLNIGFTLSTIEEIFGETFVIAPDKIEKIIYSEVNSKAITLFVPVSLDDLLFQLYWYGLDIHYEGEGEDSELVFGDSVEHEANTHPTQEDVSEINKTYPTWQ